MKDGELINRLKLEGERKRIWEETFKDLIEYCEKERWSKEHYRIKGGIAFESVVFEPVGFEVYLN